MTQPAANSSTSNPDSNLDYDAIVIGAGVAGLYQLYKLRNLGLRVRVFEAGTRGGGTWDWKSYPGGAVDSGRYSFGKFLFKGALEERGWGGKFA